MKRIKKMCSFHECDWEIVPVPGARFRSEEKLQIEHCITDYTTHLNWLDVKDLNDEELRNFLIRVLYLGDDGYHHYGFTSVEARYEWEVRARKNYQDLTFAAVKVWLRWVDEEWASETVKHRQIARQRERSRLEQSRRRKSKRLTKARRAQRRKNRL